MSTIETTAAPDWDAIYTPALAVYQDPGATAAERAAALETIVTAAQGLVHSWVRQQLPGGAADPDYGDACQEMLLAVVEMAGNYQPSRGIPFSRWLRAKTSPMRFALQALTRDEGDKKDLSMLGRSRRAIERLQRDGTDTPSIDQICEEILTEARAARTADVIDAHPDLSEAEVSQRVERWLSRQSIIAGVDRLRSGALNIPSLVSLEAATEREDGGLATLADAALSSPAADADLDAADAADRVAALLSLATVGMSTREAAGARAALDPDSGPVTNPSQRTAVLAVVRGRLTAPHAQYAAFSPHVAGQVTSRRDQVRRGHVDAQLLAQLHVLATV